MKPLAELSARASGFTAVTAIDVGNGHYPDATMGGMPQPTADAHAESLRAFGMSPLRAGIIRVTLRREYAAAADLMADLQVSRTTLVPHTQALVDAGILVQEVDPAAQGARAGFNRLVWRVDQRVLNERLAELHDALYG